MTHREIAGLTLPLPEAWADRSSVVFAAREATQGFRSNVVVTRHARGQRDLRQAMRELRQTLGAELPLPDVRWGKERQREVCGHPALDVELTHAMPEGQPGAGLTLLRRQVIVELPDAFVSLTLSASVDARVDHAAFEKLLDSIELAR